MAFKEEMFSVTLIALLLASTLVAAFSIQPTETTGTICVRANGSTDPPTTQTEQEASTLSEAPPTEWDKTYGGTLYDWARALVQTADGGYALAGEIYSSSAAADFWLVKTDSAGNAQWNKTYGGTGWDEAFALVQTVDGGYTLAGWTASYGAGGQDFWLVKTDASGTVMWNKTYGGTVEDWAYALVQTTDGGYALVGETRSYGAGDGDFWLVKTDASGTMMWNKTYGGTDGDAGYALVQTTDGGYALAGMAYSYGAGDGDFWLVKICGSGMSSTSVACSPIVFPGSSVICSAIVSGSNPTGTVTWSTNSSTGSFSQPVSNLSSGSCSTTYVNTEPGTVTITGAYSGDSSNLPSSDNTLLTVWVEGQIFQGDLVVPSGANCTIINQRLDVNGSMKIESGGTLYLENASLNIFDYRVGWTWHNNHIDVHGEVECINSTIDTNRRTVIYGDGSVYVSNSLLNKTYVYLENEYSVLDVVSSDIPSSFVSSEGSTTIMNSTIELVSGKNVSISDSEIHTLYCDPGAEVTVQSSNVSELGFAVAGDGSFNISDLKPGFLDSWDSLQNSNFSTDIPNLPNTVISNSYIHDWSFWFGSGTSGIDVFINNSDLYLVELSPATSPSPIDLPIGSLVANGSVMNLIYLQITTNGPYGITLNGLSPGFFDSWNSMQSPCISMNWWNSTTREGCLLPNITLENTRVENWSPYWGGGGGSSPQVCPSNWTLHDCNLYAFWARAQQADNMCISSSLIGELTLYGWGPPDNPTKNTTISECAIGSFFAQYFSNTLASDCTIENMLAYRDSTTCLHNCSVTSLKAYDSATVNVVDSPSTIKEMFAYDSSKTQVLNSTVSELSAFGSATVREITYEPKDSEYTIGERDAAGYPSFQSDSASNVSRNFTFEVQSKTGAPQSGVNLSLYKADDTLIQSTYTNLSGQASLKVTWGAQTQTTFGDCFTIRAQNETWQAVAQITPGSAAFQTLVLHSPYDVGIIEILSMKTVCGQGYDLPINITVTNYGAYNESFNATVYANATIIGEAQVSLNPAEETTITFKWNTTGLAYGNYSISAFASPVEGETCLTDNTLVDGWVYVSTPGDINGDQYVNAKDAVILGGAFGSTRGDPTYSPNADINSDDWCNAKDAVILGTYFGQHWS